MLFIQINRIRYHLTNLILKFLYYLKIVKTGYNSEPNYKFLRNPKIEKLISDFRYWVDDEERHQFYNSYKSLINKEIPLIENLQKDKYSKELNELKKNGCVQFSDLILSNDEINKIKKYLENKDLYLSHVVPFSKYNTKSFFLAKSLNKQASYSLEDILKCEQLLNRHIKVSENTQM